MANTTTTQDDDLLRVYSKDKLFEPCERSEPRFWNEMKEFMDERPGGIGRYFRIVGASGHAVGTPDENGDYSDDRSHISVQGSVTAAQIDSVIRLSSKFVDASEGDGSFGGDADHEAIVQATSNLLDYANILMGVGHGTGRLALVSANTTGSTTFTAKVPERAYQLRPNQPIEFVNTDTGGTVQSTAIISAIDYDTGIVTLDTAVSLTANWGVYQQNTYGKPKPNGVRNIVDDGDFRTSLFGVSAAAPNTFMNGMVLDNSGGLQDYSEALLFNLLTQITFNTDAKFVPTQMRCNMGILDEHRRITVPDRVFMVDANGKAPSYNGGANYEGTAFTFGTVRIPFKADRNLPARELYALHLPSWRKHTLRAPDWFRAKDGAVMNLAPANAGGTYAYAFIASMLMDINITCRRPNANGKLGFVRDRLCGRDA